MGLEDDFLLNDADDERAKNGSSELFASGIEGKVFRKTGVLFSLKFD